MGVSSGPSGDSGQGPFGLGHLECAGEAAGDGSKDTVGVADREPGALRGCSSGDPIGGPEGPSGGELGGSLSPLEGSGQVPVRRLKSELARRIAPAL